MSGGDFRRRFAETARQLEPLPDLEALGCAAHRWVREQLALERPVEER